VTLWIVLGVVALVALGLACSWVLRARGGLDAMYQTDPDRAARTELDVQLHTMQIDSRRNGGMSGGF
jgi:hypothetical protein